MLRGTFATPHAEMHPMSTEHSPASPAVAVGPYTSMPNGDILAVDGTAIGCVPVRWSGLRMGDFGSLREALAWAEERARVEGLLLAASWDLLAACEAWVAYCDRVGTLTSGSPEMQAMRAAVARARGLRPCDDPALVPEVMKARPQCVHGEKTDGRGYVCPKHPNATIGTLHNEKTNSGGGASSIWYTFVCDGHLEEQRESGG